MKRLAAGVGGVCQDQDIFPPSTILLAATSEVVV
jgi:hypothetical protein